MLKIFRNFYVIFLLFFSQLSFSQIDFDHISFIGIDGITTKLPIKGITQSKSGLIWIGTYGSGVYSFDGTNYKAYRHNIEGPSNLDSNIVHFVFIDREQRLWVGTDSGLNLYNENLDIFERIDFTIEQKPVSNIAYTCMVQDLSGDIYVGTYELGVLKVNVQDYELEVIERASNKEERILPYTFTTDADNRIFIGTNIGLFYLNKAKNTLHRAEKLNDQFLRVGAPNIQSLLTDKSGNLWIGTAANGLYKVDLKNAKYTVEQLDYTNKKIFAIINVDDKILLGTENDGLVIVNTKGELIKHLVYSNYEEVNLSPNSIWALYKDPRNRIWVGGYNTGVDLYDVNYSKFQHLKSIRQKPNTLKSSFIKSIRKNSDGKIWIGHNLGADIYDPVTKEISYLKGDEFDKYAGLKRNLNIETIFVDSKENIWLGTWANGIYMLPQGKNKFINYTEDNTNGGLSTNTIRGFAEDAKGNIWIASYLNGLHYYNTVSGKFKKCDSEAFKIHGLNDYDVLSIMVDSKNNVWAGTSSGLFKINYNTEDDFEVTNMRFKMIKNLEDHPSIHNIVSLLETTDGKILIGTNGAGLFQYDQDTDAFLTYNKLYGIEENTINAIIQQNDDTIWITGNTGVTKIDLVNKTSVLYKEEDGLLSNYFRRGAVEMDDQGLLYFGGYSGVNIFDSDNVKNNTVPPVLTFTDFKLFNKSVQIDDKDSPLDKVISQTKSITLTHEQSVFTIEYVGISHTRPKKNEYAYILEGFDKDWNEGGTNRSATYTNLEPGDYVFKVKSANNDGLWNKEPLSLQIKVLPPWWQTNQAYLVYWLLLFSLVGATVYFYQKRFKLKQADLLKKDKRKQEKELHERKLQFFTNISHEFRTPLTLIINPINELIAQYGDKLPSKEQRKLRVLKKNSDRLSRLINELMDFRKLEYNKLVINKTYINVIDKIRDVTSYFDEEAVYRNIDLQFISEIDQLMACVDISMIDKIMFNILSNAFKVTPQGGKITVTINSNEEELNEHKKSFKITVRDTGPGIDQKEYKRIFKRYYQVSGMNKVYYGSSGVGLEMVKSFVKLHKGKIDIDSELKKGTAFIITLPIGDTNKIKTELPEKPLVVNSDVDTNYIKENPSLKTTKQKDSQKDIKILIVEDNIELQAYLETELAEIYDTVVASNGKEGLTLAMKHHPHLIITDVIMPEMNGLELCEAIKGNLETSHIPLLMLSAKAMIEDKLKGIDSGADGYLNKPFNMDILKATISQLLTSREILFNKFSEGYTVGPKDNITTLDDQFLNKALRYIHKNIDDPELGVDQLAVELLLSRSQLYRKIKALTGLTATSFLRKVRLEEAKKIFNSDKNYNVSEVALKVGFSSPSYFTKCFKKEFGHLPKK